MDDKVGKFTTIVDKLNAFLSELLTYRFSRSLCACF